MQKIPLRHFQRMLVCTATLAMMILITACSGAASTSTTSTSNNTAQPTTGAATTTPSATQALSTPTPAATPAAAPVAFKPGGISFIGPVKTINGTSLSMTAPDGQTYTLAITAQTDRSAYGGNLPTAGSSVDMDSAINPDGSLSATILKPAKVADPDLNVIAYTGITSSAVGADRVLHFTAGTKSYTFTIPPTADLSEFGGNAQAIGNNATVKVKIQYPANTVISVGNPNGS